jgi:hypothetical protein
MSAKRTDSTVPNTLPDYVELGHIADRIEEHRSVHEMILAMARMCSDGTPQGQEFSTAVWPGVAVIMDRLSADEDELIGQVRYIEEKIGGAR